MGGMSGAEKAWREPTTRRWWGDADLGKFPTCLVRGARARPPFPRQCLYMRIYEPVSPKDHRPLPMSCDSVGFEPQSPVV